MMMMMGSRVESDHVEGSKSRTRFIFIGGEKVVDFNEGKWVPQQEQVWTWDAREMAVGVTLGPF